jgi:hypothetical protein
MLMLMDCLGCGGGVLVNSGELHSQNAVSESVTTGRCSSNLSGLDLPNTDK